MTARSLNDLRVTAVVNLEPHGMFDGSDLASLDVKEIRRLFRRACPPDLANVPFVEGSEKLISLTNLVPSIKSVAQIMTRDVKSLADMEVSGGYAFLNGRDYVFGVEEDSTLEDAFVWEQSVSAIRDQGRARILHAYDRFFDAELNRGSKIVSLRHSRTGDVYQVDFAAYASGISRATEELKRFALAVVPEIQNRLAVPEPKRYAIENFRHHPEWFSLGRSSVK